MNNLIRVVVKNPELDLITVFLEDFEPGKGKITIVCFGKAWTAYWGGMSGETVAEFFCSCDTSYLSGCLSNISSEVIDYREISEIVDDEVDQNTLMLYTTELETAYGGDWWLNLPQTPNPAYTYLCKIIEAVQEGLKSE